MADHVKVLREMFALAANERRMQEADALLAAIVALELPLGKVVVPLEATEEMLEAGRSAVMARDCSGPNWGPADHYRAAGISRDGIPNRLFEGRQKMSKAWGAELVYAAMIAAAPKLAGEVSGE